jgi:hypothetical protein
MKLSEKKRIAAEKTLLEVWGDAPKSTQVIYTDDLGKDHATRVKYPAELLSGHTAVIWLEGVSGCYLLSRVRLASPVEHFLISEGEAVDYSAN